MKKLLVLALALMMNTASRSEAPAITTKKLPAETAKQVSVYQANEKNIFGGKLVFVVKEKLTISRQGRTGWESGSQYKFRAANADVRCEVRCTNHFGPTAIAAGARLRTRWPILTETISETKQILNTIDFAISATEPSSALEGPPHAIELRCTSLQPRLVPIDIIKSPEFEAQFALTEVLPGSDRPSF